MYRAVYGGVHHQSVPHSPTMEKYVQLREERTEEHHGTYPADVERVSNGGVPYPTSPKRHKKTRRRVEVKEAGTPSGADLGETFKASAYINDIASRLPGGYPLQKAIRENTFYLKALCARQGATPVSDGGIPVSRNGQTDVEILLSFLHVIDVKTKQGCFHSEIYLQAKWSEPDLQHCTQDELDRLDFSELWKPDLVLVNAVGEPDSIKTWYTATEDCIYLHKRIRGQFTESLELKDFPVEKQDLTIVVTCERPVSEIKLVPNMKELATVTLETFSDAKEFRLWDNVEVKSLKADPHAADKYAKSSKLAFTCAVSRKPTYFLINGLLLQVTLDHDSELSHRMFADLAHPVLFKATWRGLPWLNLSCLKAVMVWTEFLIGMLTFLVYVHSYMGFSQRTGLAATLLLTSVAFQFVVQSDLPNVPYITLMGWYHLICRVFQVVILLQTGIVYYVGLTGPDTANTFDTVSFWVLLASFLIFNIIYLIILGIKYWAMHKDLVGKEKQHKEKKNSYTLNVME